MVLEELVRAADVDADVRGDGAVEISELAYDSRMVRPGTLFFCVKGLSSDGHEFAAQAVQDGAAALVVERKLDLEVPQVEVSDARAAMAPVAAAFFGDPTSELDVVGVTGTNGKTTTAFLIRELLEAAGRQCGLLGTVKRVVGGAEEEVERTTPEAIDLQRTFARMLESGDRACAMEVSSHALHQHRADSIQFDVKVFTNLTQDHLDYHGDMETYFEAKRLLFAAEGGAPSLVVQGGVSVINVDDPFGQRLAGELEANEPEASVTFSAKGAEASISARDVEFDATGSRFTCVTADGEFEVRTRLPGEFNVANALAALGAAGAIGIETQPAVEALAGAAPVPGRFEPIDEGQPFGVLVDYAHTPDSLENVLRAARSITEGRLISVFGCGGDRDRAKRPLMGKIGLELSDFAIVTSDNPRSEEPMEIIGEIIEGIDVEPGSNGADSPTQETVKVVVDRADAIGFALLRAEQGDTVVIAGKGHEQGQEFEAGRKIPFDDRDVAREILRSLPGQKR